MNKKLVALAVAGAFAVPMAAQAQTANVTLYGRLNLDVEFIKAKTQDLNSTDPTATTNTTVNRVSSNTSRLGVRGTESLGGGLNAIFQIESNVSGDTGNSSGSGFASRETFVGLQGSWGRFTMGKFLMPQDDLHGIFGNTPTLLTSILSTAALWAQGPQSKGSGGFDARTGNNLRYDTPNMSGFTAALQYSTRDSSGNADANAGVAGDNGDHASELRHAYVVGANLIYANGPISAGVAVEHNAKVRQYTPLQCFNTSFCNASDTDWTITGAYDFGTIMGGFGLRLAAVYEHTKYDAPRSLADGGGLSDLKRDFWGVSGTIPLGGGKIYLFYGRAGEGKGGAADGQTIGGLVKGPDTKADQYEVSYSYSLSPRTLLYGGYNKINNDSNAKYSFNINGYSIAQGGKPGGLIFGMVHFF